MLFLGAALRLVQDLEKMCPDWEHAAETLCENTPEMAKLRDTMIGNREYAKIGPACHQASQNLKLVRGLQRSLEYENVMRLEKAVGRGQATVCSTFVLFVLFVKVPKEPLLATRQSVLKDLKLEMSKKGFELLTTMTTRMEELLKPKEPAA